MKTVFFASTFLVASVAFAHPGPRVWIGSNGATLATYTSNNDLSPTSFTLNRVFVGGVDEKTLLPNGRLDEFPVTGTGIYASQFPGYQVRTDGNSGLATGSSFGFDLGPLLVFDGGTFKPAWNLYATQPRMNESTGAASLTSGAGVQIGFSFFAYNTPSDHAHLTTTLLGNGTQAIDGPHTIYAVPMQLTGGGKAASLPYYILFGRDLDVNTATFVAARSAMHSIVASNVGTWIVDADADWTRAGNWLANEPNAAGAVGVFGSAITAPRTITLNASRTLNRLTFDNANRYTIAGSGSLAFGAGGGTIEVVGGSHTIDVPMMTTGAFAKTGVGTIELRNVRAGAVNVNAGAVRVHNNGTDAGTSRVQSLTIASGASLDLTNNDLIVGAATSQVQVRSLITTGRLRSTVATPATTLGVLSGAQFTAVDSSGLFSGLAYEPADTLVKYTYFGDSDFNGVVNFDDYARIDSGFNNSGSDWFHGDFDLNGVVNFDDYALIDLAFNTQAGPLLHAVPEPACMAACVGAVGALTLMRHRRRRQPNFSRDVC